MKKILVLVLALVMVLAMVPTVAMAADTTLTVGTDYATIQQAVNAVGTGTTEIIIPAGTYSEEVKILQQAGKNIIITGQGEAVFNGQIIVHGGGRSGGTETLTIRNLTFKPGSSPYWAIDLKKFETVPPINYGYAHNVTVEDCTFINRGIQAGSSSGNTAYGTVVHNCKFTGLSASAIQARCTGITIEDVTVTDSADGFNLQNCSNITIKKVRVEVREFALWIGPGANAGTVNIIDSLLSSTGTGDPWLGAIIFRDGSSGNVTITGSDIYGAVRCLSSPNVKISSDDVYWGGDIEGFDPSQLNIQNDSPSPHLKDTVVTAGVDPTFTIIIPATVNLGTLQKDGALPEQDFPVEAQGVIIEAGKSIVVSVVSDFKLSTSGGATLDYELYNSVPAKLLNNGTFVTFTKDHIENGSVSVPSTAGITTAGIYSDTMTFTIAYQ